MNGNFEGRPLELKLISLGHLIIIDKDSNKVDLFLNVQTTVLLVNGVGRVGVGIV